MILFIILKVYNINKRTGDVCFGRLYPILNNTFFLNEEFYFLDQTLYLALYKRITYSVMLSGWFTYFIADLRAIKLLNLIFSFVSLKVLSQSVSGVCLVEGAYRRQSRSADPFDTITIISFTNSGGDCGTVDYHYYNHSRLGKHFPCREKIGIGSIQKRQSRNSLNTCSVTAAEDTAHV